jgi:hypothetical protein
LLANKHGVVDVSVNVGDGGDTAGKAPAQNNIDGLNHINGIYTAIAVYISLYEAKWLGVIPKNVIDGGDHIHHIHFSVAVGVAGEHAFCSRRRKGINNACAQPEKGAKQECGSFYHGFDFFCEHLSEKRFQALNYVKNLKLRGIIDEKKHFDIERQDVESKPIT